MAKYPPLWQRSLVILLLVTVLLSAHCPHIWFSSPADTVATANFRFQEPSEWPAPDDGKPGFLHDTPAQKHQICQEHVLLVNLPSSSFRRLADKLFLGYSPPCVAGLRAETNLLGSVRQKAATCSPVASLGRYFFFCSSVPASRIPWRHAQPWWAQQTLRKLIQKERERKKKNPQKNCLYYYSLSPVTFRTVQGHQHR